MSEAPILNMQYEKHNRLYFQRLRRKHASGDAAWHSRTPQLRRLHGEVFKAAGLLEMAQRIANVLSEEAIDE
jgi:hypothetical protein